MRSTFTCGLVLLFVSGCTHTEKFDDGSLKAHGPIHWASGKQTGEWKHYHQGGELRSVGSFTEDLQVGEWTYFHTDGKKEMEGDYADHRRVGLWRYFHRGNEKPSGEGRFHRGYQDGVWTFWDRTGNPIQRGPFDRGKQSLRWEYWYPGGEKKAEGYHFEGAKVGVWKFWSRDGKLAEKDYRMPAGVELIVERSPVPAGDEPAPVRRIGFQRDGKKMGRWAAYHPNGELRFVGNFDAGVPEGTWVVYSESGAELTAGTVTAGRPAGKWEAFGDSPYTWEPSADRPGAAPFTGEWLSAEDAEVLDMQGLVETYLAEMTSSIGFDDVADIARTTTEEADVSALDSSTAPQSVPTADVDWTADQKSSIKGMIKTYGDNPPEVDSKYGLPAVRDGDRSRASAMEGKPLPVTVFERAEGGELDIAKFQGTKPVLLIILRGYATRVCVYCFEQMIAYKRSRLLDEWSDKVEILVVYPGPREGLAAFRRQFEKEPDYALPDFPVLYDPSLALTAALDIVGEQAIPTTMILDSSGVVRFSYVGESIEDRPSAKLIADQLRKHAK